MKNLKVSVVRWEITEDKITQLEEKINRSIEFTQSEKQKK